jgi:hypothetical protein
MRHFLPPFIARQLIPLAAPILAVASSETQPLPYNRDVRPILSDKCFACHGFDPETRKADLRLDTREGATAVIEGVQAIVPGAPEKSEAWLRLVSKDRDEVMPPPKSHKTLSAAEKETIREWIKQGAIYQRHWAFEPAQRPPLPEVQDKAWVRNPVDAYVLSGLEQAGLKPAPEADRRTLARRVALDLTGLPPQPEEVEAFVSDKAPDAYEKLIARFLATPQWGEHRGRYWLDAARYADTHGLHIDNYREMWPYRDWVIGAFNRNMPFDQFTTEQIAGDLLPNATRDQLIATGFHRCNVTTSEGGTIAEENLATYANDRVTTTSWVWLGLTANCAACHDHKFDPITQRDFYSMAAYFRNTTQPALDGNVKDTKPVIYLPSATDDRRFAELPNEIAEAKAALSKRRGDAAEDVAQWLKTAKPESLKICSEGLEVELPLAEGEGTDLGGKIQGEAASFKASGPTQWTDGGMLGRAPVLTNTMHFDLGDVAGFDRDKPFSVGAWVNVPASLKQGTIVGRMDDRQELQGWELFVQDGQFGAQLVVKQPAGALRILSENGTVRPGSWQHVLATYDGSGAAAGLRIFVDGRLQPVHAQGESLKGTARADVPLHIGRREKGSPLIGAQVQDVRIYSRQLGAGEARWLPEEQNLGAVLALAPEKRTPEQNETLLRFYFDSFDRPSMETAGRLQNLEDERAAIQGRSTVSHVQEEKPGEAMANILIRGAYDKVGETVEPAGFSALHTMPADAPKNRLGLARWLNAPENPLTARVTVNRFWQEIFGTGLVKTPEDFGAQGDRPSNPELLDWLAVEFRESGWDVKRFFATLLTSATYRQAATVSPEKQERDPQNRLNSRGPRFRMDAEMVRDYALKASGTLSHKMGGPGTKPYQPDNIWEMVGLGGARYMQDKGESLYRRTIYNFWKRQSPSPNMEIFNAPTREACTVRRERTNTPTQALVTLNDPQFVEAARRLAEAVVGDGGDPAVAIPQMFHRVLQRPPSPQEAALVARAAEDFERHFAANQEGASALLSIGESKAEPTAPAPKLAALTMVASLLLNLDEALNK